MCCSGFLKAMMFVFNGGIFLAGAAILGVGVWVKVDSDSLSDILDQEEESETSFSLLINASYAIIAVGAVLLVIGFLGCCGAIRESKCMLLTFFSIVLIIFLIEVAGAVVLFVFEGLADEIFQDLKEEVRKQIHQDYGKEDSPVTSTWTNIMEQLHCCGFNNYTDFTGSYFYTMTGGYPEICCDATSQCSQNAAESADVTGCFDKLLEFITDNVVIFAAVAVGIAALEIAAMVVSMILYCQIGNKSRYR